KVGIPRALLYYRYYPFWEVYFKGLGAEVVISQKTSRGLLEQGIRHTLDDICLPVKAFHGHIISLCGNVDYLFIPRVVSIEKEAYTCPKFIGLPDMVKSSISNLPYIIDTVIDIKKRSLWNSSLHLGLRFTKNPLKIWVSYKNGRCRQGDFERDGGIPKEVDLRLNNGGLRIGIVGHPYIIYDAYLNLNLFSKLRKMGVSI
ncbi:MAG: acyl-CoA dehydratase activase-related protein, partial [bacterium]|nr:acyl-CoA dehydratase activase-related protein [bacterium]